VNVALQGQLSIAALVCSALALFFSLLAAFPGLKGVLVAVRDGVLWFALFLVLGGLAFVGWQQLRQPVGGITAGNHVDHARPATAERPPQFGH
jgi:hypothetical protein